MAAPGSSATVVALPPIPDTEEGCAKWDIYACPPFTTEEEYDAYSARISPSRELVCPITQEVFRDPVIAEDGHTYERTAILRWFQTGQTRSPTTNALLAGRAVVPNLAVQGMATAHRERLGRELLKRCERIRRDGGRFGDGGARVEALLDAGAALNLRGEGGATALLCLIASCSASVIPISRALLSHDAPVLTADDAGRTCLGISEEAITSSSGDPAAEVAWSLFSEELRSRQTLERDRADARESARIRTNEAHRRRQSSLAAEEQRTRSEALDAQVTGISGSGARGLGRLEQGWGYFPSLAALQFQRSVPPPSASIVETELRDRRRLDAVLQTVGAMVLIYLVIS